MNVVSSGLEGVCVGDSHISLVDGQAGRLILRGFHLQELGHKSYEEMAQFLSEARSFEACREAPYASPFVRLG